MEALKSDLTNYFYQFFNKRVILILGFLSLFLFFVAHINNVNSVNATSELYLDSNGWCAQLPVSFRIYNKSEYGNRTTIEDNLCSPSLKCDINDCALDANKDKDECKDCSNCDYFTLIRDAKVVIYDGPFDSGQVLFDKTLSDGIFNYTFSQGKMYLVKITPPDNSGFKDFEKVLNIEDCKYINTQTDVNTNLTTSNSSNNSLRVLKNSSFEFMNNSLVVSVQSSNLSKDDIKIILNPKEIVAPKDSTLVLGISLNKNRTYQNFSCIIKKEYLKIDFSNLRIKKLSNFSSNKWQNYSFNLTKTGDLLLTEPGVYAVYNSLNMINFSKDSADLNTKVESQNNSSKKDIKKEPTVHHAVLPQKPVSQNSNKKLLKFIFWLVIIVLLGFSLISFVKKRKGLAKNKEVNQNEEVVSYSDMIQVVSDYVDKYKKNFSSDQIYRALKRSQVPIEIIDEVFKMKF